MGNKKKTDKKKVLVIVAHPDDETIWMGGTLLMHREDWQTTIISLCRRDDKDRAPKFKRACKIFNANCFISDLEDEELKDEKVKDAIARINFFIDEETGKKFDFIFTHGKNGEYGHKRHIDVHKAVVRMLKEGGLQCKKLFLFSYSKKAGACEPRANSDKFIYLNDLIFKRKKYLIKDIYGFKEESLENKYSLNTESFKVKKRDEVFNTLCLPP